MTADLISGGGLTHPAPVVVLLSTYNGERYLEYLLDSLLRQDYPNFKVVIRDDGSVDGTSAILRKYSEQNRDKLIRTLQLEGNVGVTRSFFSLLDCVDPDTYIMFCDQDDVWFDDKISTFMTRIREVERQRDAAVMVFGDMMVTDQNLNVIARSFWEYQRLDPDTARDWRRLLISNVVTGCSSMCNPSAVELLRNAPLLTVLHDHLAAIVVARHGTVAALTKPTMFYRQHHSNAEGARAFGLRYLSTRLPHFLISIIPRYLSMCKVFDLPVTLAIYLKFESALKRLTKAGRASHAED